MQLHVFPIELLEEAKALESQLAAQSTFAKGGKDEEIVKGEVYHAYIRKIDNKGLMTIAFNDTVVMPENLIDTVMRQKSTNHPVLFLRVKPSPDSDKSKLGFEWEI